MIKKLTLRNYRGFRNHAVPFESLSIVVGRNNAGKSTIVEALRLVSIVANRAQNLMYANAPDWLDVPAGARGVTPSLKGIDFDFRNVCHHYNSDSPAIITADLLNGQRISIYIDAESQELFSVITSSAGQIVSSKAQAANFFSAPVNIMPPIGPLARTERLLGAEYVNSSLNTNLAPIHFRNQLFRFREEYRGYYDLFVQLASDTWEHLQIKSLEGGDRDQDLVLLVRDGPFVAEAAWVGHGLQAWLQTIWFLARTNINSTVIFDEPDIYLHADLQRKLIKLLKNRFPQVIVATHSIEIMADVEPENILIIDKNSSSSRFATTLPGVQNVIERFGGVHNLQLSRLWAARRCLLVEGKDVAFLSIFQLLLNPETEDPIDTIPQIPLGGWGNWRHAIGATIGLKNAGDKAIKTYCILDSDYKTQDEMSEIHEQSVRHGLQLHIWNKKEIENYLLVPTAIHRYILQKSRRPTPRFDTVIQRLDKICDNQKEGIMDAIATEILSRDKNYSLSKANKAARQIVSQFWSNIDGKLSIVSGKRVLSELSSWSQKNYGVSMSPHSIARSLKAAELDGEVIFVVSRISQTQDF